jgi:hypothetical protein
LIFLGGKYSEYYRWKLYDIRRINKEREANPYQAILHSATLGVVNNNTNNIVNNNIVNNNIPNLNNNVINLNNHDNNNIISPTNISTPIKSYPVLVSEPINNTSSGSVFMNNLKSQKEVPINGPSVPLPKGYC